MKEISDKCYSTSMDIAEIWIKCKKARAQNSRKEAEYIIKRFNYILKDKLKLNKDEINWFKEDLSNGSKGNFIFDVGAEYWMYELFKAFGNFADKIIDKVSLMEDLERYLINILPKCIDEQCLDKRKQRIIEAVEAFCEETWEKQFNNNKWNNYFDKEILSVPSWYQIKNKEKQKLYKFLYQSIKEWHDKWLFIMDKFKMIRFAERFDNISIASAGNSMSFDQRYTFIETEELDNKEILEEYKRLNLIDSSRIYLYLKYEYEDREEEGDGTVKQSEPLVKNFEQCCEKCDDLFSEVISHSLRQQFKADFEYIFMELFEDLFDIRNQVQEEALVKWYRQKCGGDAPIGTGKK